MFRILKKREEESDENLLLRYQQTGDRFVLGLLLRRYSDKIYGTCHYYLRNETDTEDAAMEVCELVVRKLQPKTEIKSFKDWIFIVARNYCFRKLKENQRLIEISKDWQKNFAEPVVQKPESDALYLEEEHLFNRLDQELQQLNTSQQQCLIAFYWRGERYKEIASRLNMSVDEVRSAIQNGRRNLKNRLI